MSLLLVVSTLAVNNTMQADRLVVDSDLLGILTWEANFGMGNTVRSTMRRVCHDEYTFASKA